MAARVWGAGSVMDGNWNTNTCWTGDVVPQGGDDVTFNATDVTACAVNVVTAELGSLTIGGTASGNYSGTITGTNKIQMTGNMVIEDGCTGTLDMNADIDIDGNFTGDGAGVTVLCGSGTWTVGGNFDNRHIGTWTRETSTLVMNGAAKTIISAGFFTLLHNLTIDGSITAPTSGGVRIVNLLTVSFGNSLTVDNTTVDVDASISNAGTITINVADELRLLGGGTLANTGTVDGGGTVEFRGGTLTNTGTWSVTTTNAHRSLTIGDGIYGGAWTCKAANNANHTLTLGTAGGQTITWTGNIGFDADQAGKTYEIKCDTHDPALVFQGDVNFGESGGTFIWTNGTGGWTLNGSNAQTIALLGKGVENITVNKDAVANTVLLEDGFTTGDFLLTQGTLTFNAGAETYSCDIRGDASGDFTIGVNGQVVPTNLEDKSFGIEGDCTLTGTEGDLLNLEATGGWTLTVDGANVAHWADIAYCDSDGTNLDATDNCEDKGNNEANVIFAVAASRPSYILGGNILSA